MREPDLVVELTVPAGEAELAADRCWQAGATAVRIDDSTEQATITASFPTPDAARTVAAELGEPAEGADPGHRDVRLVEVDPSWQEGWKEFAEPFAVGEHLLVAPSWRRVDVGDRLTISIDPGPCFGSGSHPSTRLLLAELDRRPPVGLDVLDLGCGSGILSVAAALLGARSVISTDIDPEAARITGVNAEANGVVDRIKVTGSVPAAAVDLALVNVTAGVHAEVGASASAAVRPGGVLLLAGLLPGQWRHIENAYAGTELETRLELDGWEGARLMKRAQ